LTPPALSRKASHNFNLENDLGYVPVGLGAGKVMQMGKVTANLFVGPQYTVTKYGEQVPHWQRAVFMIRPRAYSSARRRSLDLRRRRLHLALRHRRG
jgi:hypothetical protein